MLDQQPVASVPVPGPVLVQDLLVPVPIPLGPGGLGLVDPPLWDQQPICQELFPEYRLTRLLQRAVLGQNLPDRPLPLAVGGKMLILTSIC